MDMSAEQRRLGFGVWMRTGRWPLLGDRDGREVKFNPWHDPTDGRFTFIGTGRNYGPGGTGRSRTPGRSRPKIEYVTDFRRPTISTRQEVEIWKAEELAKHGHKPGYRRAIEEQYRRYLHQLANPSSGNAKVADDPDRLAPSTPTQNVGSGTGSGFSSGGGRFGGAGATGSWENPPAPGPPQRQDGSSRDEGGFSGGGGSFGGGGATGSGDWPTAEARQKLPERVGTRGSQPADRWRHVARNGYLFELDEQDRTRRVSGELTYKTDQRRSKTAQRAAGGSDRRASDDGGHYIARRFNGPTEAFNHFAQDRSFNRGDYLRLEEEWARAKRASKSVRVKIVPMYQGGTQRPSTVNVWFWIDGARKSARFSNEPKGGKRGG